MEDKRKNRVYCVSASDIPSDYGPNEQYWREKLGVPPLWSCTCGHFNRPEEYPDKCPACGEPRFPALEDVAK